MTPFVYPKKKHVRTQRPPSSSNYRMYKPFLRSEFIRQCVYCRMPDGISKGQREFGVDHYRPTAKFPALETEYSNLFYACNACNGRKGAFWPNATQARRGYFVPNPCAHVMRKHVEYRGAEAVPLTRAGLCADDVLCLNDDESLQFREFVQRALDRAQQDWLELRGQLGQINKAIRNCKQQARRAKLEAARAEAKADLNVIVADIERYCPLRAKAV